MKMSLTVCVYPHFQSNAEVIEMISIYGVIKLK